MVDAPELTDDTFTAVTSKRRACVVVFWAAWAGPCRLLDQTLAEVTAEGEHIPVLRLNVDDNSNTPVAMGVRGVPTLMRLEQGKVVDMRAGALNADDCREMLKPA